jgi:hypothetical protein
MDLKSAKIIANILIALGNVNFKQVRDAVSPLSRVLDNFVSKGQEIVFGELVWDGEWIFESQTGDGPDGCTISHPAEGTEDLNTKYTYDAIGLYMSDASLDFVEVLAVGEVLTFDEGTPEPPENPIGVDDVVKLALGMASFLGNDNFEADHFSDSVYMYFKHQLDQKELNGIRPRHNHEWGRFNANAEKWGKDSDREALRWLVMNSVGHPYAEAVQLRVRMGYAKFEEI